MKKLAFVLILTLSMTVLSGCKDREARFNPDNDTSVTIEVIEDGDTAIEPMVIGDDKGPDLAFTGIDGDKMETNVGYHVIRGTAPRATSKVMVNDYTLKKYLPGQTSWSYITSESLGTLQEGKNKYVVKAIDAEGNTIQSETLKITYTKTSAPELPDVGTPLAANLLISLAGASIYAIKRKKIA